MDASEAVQDYSQARRRCDIVMKGGITSGVVYPLAVCELARAYRFMRVGGASAGAIAAALTAAAELRRRRGDSTAFTELEALPAWLGTRGEAERAGQGRSNLLALFNPERATRAAFDTALALLGRGPVWRRGLRAARVVLSGHALAALIGLLPGLALGLLALEGVGLLRVWALVCGLGLAVAGAAVAGALALLRRTVRVLPGNLYGLATGLSPSSSGAPPLTVWLADALDRLAGQADPERPVTFGDLRAAPDGGIELEVVTTGLTHGRPYRLPFENETFYFDPGEWRRLFPERIVRFLETHARPARSPRDAAEQRRLRPLVPLPAAADLPVAVAVRMSLSFPLLVSAVPLHAVDRTRRRVRGPDGRRPAPAAERCWFSDGGICSNFPVHFFDQPLPRWPTFAVNLRRFPPDYPRAADERANVWMPRSNRGGIEATWERFDEAVFADANTGASAGASATARVGRFLGAVLTTMQSWQDNTLSRAPGYRDRVVHILHADDEGGLNLDMDAATIRRLGERGRAAGRLLRQRFAEGGDGSGLGWDNHRWVRLRSTLALLEETLQRLRHALTTDDETSDALSFRALVERDGQSPPASYRLRSAAQRALAERALIDLVRLAEDWQAMGASLGDGAPRPQPELTIRPRM